jgi:arylsulfatase A-like enzyme
MRCFAWATGMGLLLALAIVVCREEVSGAETRPLNVLVLITDQHHAAALGCAGNPVVKTPNFDRLAAGGTRFLNSFCAVPYCSPTRAAIVTGRYPSSLGIGRNINVKDDALRLRDPCDTYLHHLAARGYHCHQLGKWHLGDPAELSCFSDNPQDEKLFHRMMAERQKAAGDQRFDAGPRPGESERIKDVYLRTDVSAAHRKWSGEKGTPQQDVGVIGRSAIKPEFSYESMLADYCIDLLKRHRNEPFAITYSVSPPHAPWVVPAPYYDMYDPAKLPLPATWNDHPTAWLDSAAARMGRIYGETGFREYLRCYYGQVTMMDACVGRILQALDDLGLADRTLVIFTSDHGNMLGQHGMMDKTLGTFYDDLMRVPLLMRLPSQIPAAKTCDSNAVSVDVAPTILDYLGAPPLAQAQGHSLRPYLDGAKVDDGPTFGERGEPNTPAAARMIRTRQWKLCLLPKGEKEFYDLTKDPDETRNLADDPAMAPMIRKLSAQLIEHMRSVGDPALPKFADR